MSQKAEKPVLQGQRIKTRKRDEKEKYDPGSFRDAVVAGLDETEGDLELISKYLDSAGSKLDYRRYSEVLLDILFAGGILAPGGSIAEESDGAKTRTQVCLFMAKDDYKSLYNYYEIFYKMIRRYKYIEKVYQDEMKKLIVFLKGFREEERRKLGKFFGISLANGLGNASCLVSLLEEHLVKDGIAMDFATHMFATWLKEKDITQVASTLKKGGLEGKLMELLPINKRTQENFEKHFMAANLEAIVDYQRAKASAEMKKELYKQLDEMIKEEEPVKEIISTVQEYMKRNSIPEHEAVIMVWVSIMKAGEWNKKDELVAEQSIKHLKSFTPLFSALTKSGRSELVLIQKVQEFCYDNISFQKAFQKIVVFLYKVDVLSEDVILKWYKDSHLTKGKSVFLEQMKKFVEWLQSAEEESEEEEEEEEEEDDEE